MADSLNFTPTEAKFFCSMMQHLRGAIDTDWTAVAEDCKLANAGSAKGTWNNIKRKKGIGGGKPAGTKTASPEKRKATEEHGDDAAIATESPEKKKRERKAKTDAGTKIKAEDTAEQDAV